MDTMFPRTKQQALDLAFVDTIAMLHQCAESARRSDRRTTLAKIAECIMQEVPELLAAIGDAGSDARNYDAASLIREQMGDVFDGEFLAKWRAEEAEDRCRDLESNTPQDRAESAADAVRKDRRERVLVAAE